MEKENAVKTAKKQRGVPFKKGFDERRNLKGRPKGRRNFETDFMLACQEVAEVLRLGKDPEKIKIELIKRGIREALAGRFQFWENLMNRIFGKPKDEIKLEMEEKINLYKEFEEKMRKIIEKEEKTKKKDLED